MLCVAIFCECIDGAAQRVLWIVIPGDPLCRTGENSSGKASLGKLNE
jgi:hypothetical protein